MHDIEIFASGFENLCEHCQLQRTSEFRLAVKSQSLRASWDEICFCLRVTGREQRNFVTASHEFFGDVRNHSLSAAVQSGRHAFIERSNLCDAQALKTGASKIPVGIQIHLSRDGFRKIKAARKLPFVGARCASKSKGIARKTSENYAIRFRRERNPQHSSVFGTTKILPDDGSYAEKKRIARTIQRASRNGRGGRI